MTNKPTAGQPYSWRFDLEAARPSDFIKADWTVVKTIGKTMVATHKNGVTRRLPAAWMKQE